MSERVFLICGWQLYSDSALHRNGHDDLSVMSVVMFEAISNVRLTQ